jgi:hypothetical protein
MRIRVILTRKNFDLTSSATKFAQVGRRDRCAGIAAKKSS